MSDNFENNSNGFEPFDSEAPVDEPKNNEVFGFVQEESAEQAQTAEPAEASIESEPITESSVEQEAAENSSFAEPTKSVPEENHFSSTGYYNTAENNNAASYNAGNNSNPYAGNQYGYQGGYQGGYQQSPYQPNPYQQPSQAPNYQNGYYNPNPQPSEPVQPYNFGSQNSFVPPTSNVPNGGTNGNSNKKSSKGKLVAAIVIVLVVVVGIVSAVKSLSSSSGSAQVVTQTTVQEAQNDSSDSTAVAVAGEDTLQYSTTSASSGEVLTAVEVAKKARASVVGVMTYQNGQLSGEGSGVVMSVDSTGKYTYIITCAHVINESGATFRVSTLDDKTYEAEMVATDTRTDIGVLKVEATDLSPAEFGDSTTLQVGETVYAIGNPGGSDYFGSMTNGIVSAIDRSVSGTYTMTCIQHNAAINPGNSGGALLNSAGQVIGINSSKIAATDYEGMGFAIPIATVKSVVDNLIAYGYVPNRPKLGIEYTTVDNYQLYSMVVAIKNLPAGSLVIAGISSDSSLANTDAQVGDLIIGVNGQDMDSSDVLLDLINTGAVGDNITLTLCRVDNRTYQTTTFDVTITLIEDKGDSEEEEETTTAASSGGYNYGGASSFEDFFNEYFGGFGN